MDVTLEAKQIMVQALGKMYSSRTQRGGVRLHRSLLLTLVVKSAREIYHSARLSCENLGDSVESVPDSTCHAEEEPMDAVSSPAAEDRLDRPAQLSADDDNCKLTESHRQSRKRRSNTTADPNFLPCKKAKLELRVYQTSQNNSANCARAIDSLALLHIPRTVVTF